MVAIPVLNSIEIKSYKGAYHVHFSEDVFFQLSQLPKEKTQIIVDEKVFSHYKNQFENYLSLNKINFILADEKNKNINKFSDYVESLMKNQVKLDHTLVAIGGGITQDITCFLAATLFRGMQWIFVPTTLLAQADSCIGSKSSINVGSFKNLMGTFTPPSQIFIDLKFLDTLSNQDIASGIGEILKVHMIKGISYFEKVLSAFDKMKKDRFVLREFIENSLLYKKEMIELDEFDKGPRNVMNYGHSYGHAIETATDFAIPHGVAVTIGMDMANYQSYKMSRISKDQFQSWHTGLQKNYQSFSQVKIDLDSFIGAIRKDKKNIGTDLSLILVRDDGPIEKVKVAADSHFLSNCRDFLSGKVS